MVPKSSWPGLLRRALRFLLATPPCWCWTSAGSGCRTVAQMGRSRLSAGHRDSQLWTYCTPDRPGQHGTLDVPSTCISATYVGPVGTCRALLSLGALAATRSSTPSDFWPRFTVKTLAVATAGYILLYSNP